MSKIKQLFNDDENKSKNQTTNKAIGNNDNKFGLNRKFAKTFEDRKKRQQLDKLKSEYSNKQLNKMAGIRNDEAFSDSQESSSSSDEEEDEHGELVNEVIGQKFIETLTKIREKDPSIYNKELKFFSKKDFKTKEQASKGKALKYNQLLKSAALQELNDESNDEKRHIQYIENDMGQDGETLEQERIRIKNEFIQAAKADKEESGQEFLKVKQKHKSKNKSNDDETGTQTTCTMALRGIKQVSAMSEADQFLNQYILKQGWKEEENDISMPLENDDEAEAIDKEDSERDSEMDHFEKRYNFRFEEPQGDSIVTYERGGLEDSLRFLGSANATNKRKEQRVKKRERQTAEKQDFKNQLEQLKQEKKQAILTRLDKIYKVAGKKCKEQQKGISNPQSDFEKFMDKDYDSDEYNANMQKEFGAEFYSQKDADKQELKKYMQSIMKEEEDQLNEINQSKNATVESHTQLQMSDDKQNVLNAPSAIPLVLRRNLKGEEATIIQSANQSQMWWYCDLCNKGIPEKAPHFDCNMCPDYTLCALCRDSDVAKQHTQNPLNKSIKSTATIAQSHSFQKRIVPLGCGPPEDEEIISILSRFRQCHVCHIKIHDEQIYYRLNMQKEDKGNEEEMVLCEVCLLQEPNEKVRNQYVRVLPQQSIQEEDEEKEGDGDGARMKNLVEKEDFQKIKQKVSDETVQQLCDEYYDLDFEDVIAGGLKTKFKYNQVRPDSYGLDDEHILFSDDKLLNDFVSVKKLATYRTDQGEINEKQLVKKRTYVFKNAKHNLKKFKKELKVLQKTISEIKQVKKKKTKSTNNEAKQIKLQLLKEKQNKLQKFNYTKTQKSSKKEESLEQKSFQPNVSHDRLRAYGFYTKQ